MHFAMETSKKHSVCMNSTIFFFDLLFFKLQRNVLVEKSKGTSLIPNIVRIDNTRSNSTHLALELRKLV